MSVRLNNYWVPKSYDLDLSVSLQDWNTFGEEIITLCAPQQSSSAEGSQYTTFTLHAGAALKVLSVGSLRYIIDADGYNEVLDEGVTVKIADRCEKRQIITFAFDGLPRAAEQISFNVKFQNPINPELRGLYRCTYKEKKGDVEGEFVERRMASTHFEPVGARLMYLCVDEPAVRVAFNLTVRLPKDLSGYTVLSNAPVESKTVHPEDLSSPSNPSPSETGAPLTFQTHFPIVYKFQEVKAIPTYLTALVVGDLEYIECSGTAKTNANTEDDCTASEFKSNTPIRFYTVKGKSPKARFALDVARFSLHYFEKFFQSKFPMPKLDLVAVPDFPIGGMENWGCICVTETCLMPYEKETDNSVSKLKSVCNLIIHEVSHNWFGNLVGIDWWNGLWLKEGFATWCGIQGTIAFRPQLREDHSFYGDMNGALGVDGFAGSHPIEVAIDDPADITQVFDAISYDKGMSVCNMLQAYLGPEQFSKGLAAYIKQYAYKNTTTIQLWKAIEGATGMPVVEVMESFTSQKGFPLVSVGLAGSEESTPNFTKDIKLEVSQEKFAYLGCPEKLPDAIWRVPLRIVVLDASNGEIVVDHRTVLSEKQSTITIPAVPTEKIQKNFVLLVNPGGGGFYRVHYTTKALSTSLLKHYAAMPELFRRSVLNDLVSIYMCGKKDLNEVVELLTASITTEESFAIFNDALEGSSFLQGNLLSCGCGKPHHHGSEESADAGVAAAASATADAAVTIAAQLRLAVSQRCEKISLELLFAPNKDKSDDSGSASLTPEQKMIRTYALGASFNDRKQRLAKEIDEVEHSSTSSSPSWKSDDTLLKWAAERVKEFYGEVPTVPAYTVTDPDTLSMCLSVPLVSDKGPEYPAFAKLLAVYPHVEAAPEKAIAVLTALCTSGRNMAGLQQLFKNCTRNNGIRSMWGSVVVAALCRNKLFSKDHLWSHWKEDWAAIFSQWGNSQFRIQRMIGALAHNCGSLDTAAAAADWKNFFKANPCPAAKLDIERGHEMILLRSLLKERDGPKFSASAPSETKK